MIFVAICYDGEGPSDGRAAVFEAHVGHIVSHLDSFLLAAAFAGSDDTSAAGDDPDLAGSIFVLDVPDAEAGRRIVGADPFNAHVWREVKEYLLAEPAGSLPNGAKLPFAPGAGGERCYLALGEDAPQLASLLVTGRLTGTSDAGPSSLRAMALFLASSLGDARRAAGAAAEVYVLPAAVGRWTSLATREQLVAARG